MPKYHMQRFDPASTRDDDINVSTARLVGRDKVVLELGCATGYLAEYLQQACACRVVGVEVDVPSARVAQGRGVECIVGDLETEDTLQSIQRWIARETPFDVVVASNVLEHLRNPEKLLRAVRGFLAQDGYLVVALPNIAHWIMRRELLRGRFRYTPSGVLDETHLRFYTVTTGAALLENSGYAVEQRAYDPGQGIPLLSALGERHSAFKHMEAWLTSVCPGLLTYQTAYRARPDWTRNEPPGT